MQLMNNYPDNLPQLIAVCIRVNHKYTPTEFKRRLRFKYLDFCEKNKETGFSMQNFCFDKIAAAMLELKNQILKQDGIHSNKRVLFAQSIEVTSW